jgi:peptidoglycan hydrolase CwlO-like protein
VKKPVLAALIVVLVIFAGAITVLSMKYKETANRYTETKAAEQAVRTQFDAALESIVAIQDSLNAIVPEEDRLMHLSQNPEARVTRTQKEQMLSAIADLKLSISASKQRIKDLERSLEGSQARVASLLKVIDGLKAAVQQREMMVQRLTGRVDSLNVAVAGLQTDVRRGEEQIAAQQTVIEQKQKEIGTIYYVVGTKKELLEKGIITETGGLIGIGKSPKVSGLFNQSDFEAVDTDQVSQISIHGTRPEMLSAQSKDSYDIGFSGDQPTLFIRNPREFRKVKYVVIMVKDKTA